MIVYSYCNLSITVTAIIFSWCTMKTVAELVNALFATHRKSNGREYSNADVAKALNGRVDPSHLSRLRAGQIKNPSRETLLALCTFFKVPSSYFFPELKEIEEAEKAEEEEETKEDPIAIATRFSNLSPAVRKKLDELLRALEDDEEDT